MERILVTGGGGFIGSHLARYLYLQGNFVRVVDIKFDDYIKERYYSERLQLDLRVWENCLAVTKGIDKVYNLAANMGGIGFITSVGAEVMHDNVLINTFMLEASRQNKVKRFLFSSSACVYPTYRQTDPNVKGLKEEDAYPADPDNFYGWEKLFTEKMCEADGYGVETEQLALAIRNGLRVVEVPITVRYRGLEKTSKRNPMRHGAELIGIALKLIVEKRPLLFLGVPGAMLIMLGIGTGMYLLWYFNATRYFSIPMALITLGALFMGMILFITSLMLYAIIRHEQRDN